MKVVHINKYDKGGGAAVAALRIHKALLKEGVNSHVLVLEKKGDAPDVTSLTHSAWDRLRNFWKFVRERLSILPEEAQASMRYNISVANTGVDISQHPLVLDADIIHLHWVNQGFLSMDSLRKLAQLKKPIIWTLHDMWPFTGCCHYAGSCLEFNEHCGFCTFLKNPKKHDISARLLKEKKEIYSKMNLSVVSCSQWLSSFASSGALFRKAHCTSIPNPIDTDEFRPLDKQECRRALGLPENKKLLLFGAAKVSDVRKGYRYLDEALRIISDSFPIIANQIELVIFGHMKGADINELNYRVHSMEFVNDTDTLVKLYNAADAFVLPSLQDNLPNTVVESLACGTPVVGFRIGGVPEMVNHGRTGYLAEVKNSFSLALGIYQMMFFDQEKGRQRVREEAEETFGESKVAKQYLEVYESALSRQAAK